MAQNPNAQLQKARALLMEGHTAAAQALIAAALQRVPRHPLGNYLLGMTYLLADDAAGAVAPLQTALAADPANGDMLDGLGAAFLALGRNAEAEALLRRAAAKPHAPAAVHMRLGVALLKQAKAEALPILQRVAGVMPQDTDAQLNYARALHVDGHLEAARDAYLRVLQLMPQHAAAADALAAVCLSAGRYREAAAYLRAALQRDDTQADAWLALGKALFETGELSECETAIRRALALDPASAGACSLLANLQAMRGDVAACVDTLERGYARTQDGELLGMLVFQSRQLCDWTKWRQAWDQLAPRLASGDDVGSPFWLLCEPTTAAQQLAYTRAWARRRFDGIRPLPPPPAHTHQRVRIGYLSSDLHEHATAYLIVEILEKHDRGRFEIFAYSYGPDDGSPMRARLRAACEHFVDIGWDTDEAAARRIRGDEIDILVDLKGYTTGDRVTILARRPAPIQMTWLGYPGTTATPHIDYVIADPVVIPPGAENDYSERVLRMPHSYQPNDRARAVAAPLDRAAYGLPNDAFVFCCFNQAYKITPEVFAVWMRLLARIPHAVLWLLAPTAGARTHLASAAAASGVDADRIVYAPRRPNPEHLARYGVADLALDTFPYTSHTTLSDALWCACPAVALAGSTFASRVSASLLHAAALPQLICADLAASEILVAELATQPAHLHQIRSQLAAARTSVPLFDSSSFTSQLEALYLQARARHSRE